ncbi:hypothetical protein BDW22DRAFT_1361089 [Trametopsis cervina]|nr:hypothetical protein BDW22DRAFT_1361089 [Trametopsis cervina]
MLSSVLLTALLAVTAVRADPTPTVPGPNDVYNAGGNCLIQWDADTTGVWNPMYIELMTGANLNMKHLTTVATVDGTDPTNTTLTYPCPGVTPNAAIYFYQFTAAHSNVTMWTTRFAIADASGKVVPPPQATQPNGDPIPWGDGALLDPSVATPPPPKGSANSTTTNSASSGSSAPAVTPSGFSASSSSASLPTASSLAASKSGSSSPSSSSAQVNSTNGAAATNSASGLSNSLTLGAASLAAFAAALAVAL